MHPQLPGRIGCPLLVQLQQGRQQLVLARVLAWRFHPGQRCQVLAVLQRQVRRRQQPQQQGQQQRGLVIPSRRQRVLMLLVLLRVMRCLVLLLPGHSRALGGSRQHHLPDRCQQLVQEASPVQRV